MAPMAAAATTAMPVDVTVECDPTAGELGQRLPALLRWAARSEELQQTQDGGNSNDQQDGRTDTDAFWDALPGPTTADVGLAIATLSLPKDRLVTILGRLADRRAPGIARVLAATWDGLRVAKRWDVLRVASSPLLRRVHAGILERMALEGWTEDELTRVYLGLWWRILLGFQHSGELLVATLPEILALGQRLTASAAACSSACLREFVVGVSALVHLHRGYEVEALKLRQALEAFGVPAGSGDCNVETSAPIATCEAALRDAAWILPPAELNKHLSTVEGHWELDEFSTEQHAAGAAQAPQNAGSIAFRKVSHCLAYDVQGTLVNDKAKTELHLDGALLLPVDSTGTPKDGSGSSWRLEGHWCQLLEPGASAPAVSAAQQPPEARQPWSCPACTLNNEASVAKCATCGTPAPATSLNAQVTRSGGKASNPAPFVAGFHGDSPTFTRIRWSRGEQHGVWLARREPELPKHGVLFDFAEALMDVVAHTMTDDSALPAFAYSPRGEPSRVLTLEKLYPLSTYGELAFQLWIRPEFASSVCDDSFQVVLSTPDFILKMLPTGQLEWDVGRGMYTMIPEQRLISGHDYHVTLWIGTTQLQMFVDGALVTTVERSTSNTIPTSQSHFFIGGTCLQESGSLSPRCFLGHITDLRVWSGITLSELFAYSPAFRLDGSESHLLGYFPLVGDSPRLFVDASSHENHATLCLPGLSGSLPKFDVESGTIPSSCVGTVPVSGSFTNTIGAFELSGARLTVSDAIGGLTKPGLVMHNGSAVWSNSHLTIAEGFDVSFDFVDPNAKTRTGRYVFALCETSYWTMSSCIREATWLVQDKSSKTSALCLQGTSLMVVSEYQGDSTVSISVYVWKGTNPALVSRASGLNLCSTEERGLHIVYQPSLQLLSIGIVGTSMRVDTTIDLVTALQLPPKARVRAGVIVPCDEGEYAIPVPTQPIFRHWLMRFPPNHQMDGGDPALFSIYPLLRSGLTDPKISQEAVAPTDRPGRALAKVACTRSASDGSAFEQPTFGCQNCNIIHGAGMCQVCAYLCHDGHDLVYLGNMITACACAMRGSGLCKCQSPSAVDVKSPRVSFWCCNRCTVVNPTNANECSVCGNKAPTLSGVDAPSSSQVNSTSRALVAVDTSKTVPVAPSAVPMEWSCAACTYLNAPDATKCVICETPQPAPPPSTGDPSKSASDGLMTLYYAAAENRSHDVSAHPEPIPWACPACTMANKATDDTCFMCSSSRPTSETVAVSKPTEKQQVDPALEGSSSLNYPVQDCRAHCARNVMESLLKDTELSPVEVRLGLSWETTVGVLSFSAGPLFAATYVDGKYSEKDGYVHGIVRMNHEGQWQLEGRYRKFSQTQENAVKLTWSKDLSRFDGRWYRGDGSGEWKCVYLPHVNNFRGLAIGRLDTVGVSPFYSGLINMKQNLTNVCYQNSFIQTLFVTNEFRRLIINSQSMEVDGGMLNCIQELFTRLLASQRPHQDTHALQRCLPSSFQTGRQQDTSDFAHFLIDALSDQLVPELTHSDTLRGGLSEVFGGTQATILACKSCGKKSVNREYFWELLLNMIDLRYTPITEICAVSGVSSSDISVPSGFERLNQDLNKDRSGAPYIYLCTRRSPEESPSAAGLPPITDLVVKAVPVADPKPTVEGYERVELDLNLGGASPVIGGKKQVYLLYRREPHGSPITDLQVIQGNEPVPDGFKQIRVDLNQGDGSKVFLCYRCDMPLTDLKILPSGIPGYKMIDHVLNLSSEDTSTFRYLAYKVGGADPCVTDLQMVPSNHVAELVADGWESLGVPDEALIGDSSQNLRTHLMVRRGHGNPIVAIDVFRAPRQVPRYNDYEVIDLYESTQTTSLPGTLRGDWMAGDGVDRTRKAVRIHALSEVLPETLVVRGTFDDKGEISAVATTVHSSWSHSGSSESLKRILRVTGHWKSSKTKVPQLFDVEIRPGGPDGSLYSLNGTVGDGKGRSIGVSGSQTSQRVRVKWPITEILVLRGDERVPEGVDVLRETCSGKTGNVLAQTNSPYTLYLATRRAQEPIDGYVTDICVIYGDIDAVPEGYICVEATPAGHSANLNDGTSGVPIFICYKQTLESKSCVSELALMWTSGGAQADSVPSGFNKIQHTPLGMEANLNQGTNGVAIHLCFAKQDTNNILKPIEDALNGEYEIVTSPSGSVSPTAQGTITTLFGKFIQLAVFEHVEDPRTIEGKFGTVFHGVLPGMIRGTLYTSALRRQRVITGTWMSDSQNLAGMIDFVPPSYPFEWVVSDSGDELDGWWSGVDEVSTSSAGQSNSESPGHPWKLTKDSYVRLAFKKDYGSEWRDGRLVSSERVWRHDVASMLSRFVATRTLGGDNLLSCSSCEKKTESRTHTVVVSPPSHLILTLKRMYYDWAQQKTRKCLHDVTFPSLLTLPALDSEDEETLYGADEDGIKVCNRNRQYGLYGVLVHSGLTANSGHYYSFCRESDDAHQQLHVPDSPLAPWIKFNDMKVEKSSWEEIRSTVERSVSDTVYLLLYKRLSYDVTNELTGEAMAIEAIGGDDEDEAMLLAKAMALSMSAATEKKNVASSSEHEANLRIDSMGKKFTNRSVLEKVEDANTEFIMDIMHSAASDVHVEDLHKVVSMRHHLPSNLLHQD